MNELNKAKEIYNSIEIPQELNEVVKNAIEKSKRKTPVKVHVMRFAPVAACAVICLAIGINALPDFGNENNAVQTASFNEEAASPAARIMPERGTGKTVNGAEAEKNVAMDMQVPAPAYNAAVQVKIEESIKLTVALESAFGASGELQMLYSDENIISYSVTTKPSGIVQYFNIFATDGSDIRLETLIKDTNGYRGFYFKDKDTIVVFAPTGKTELKIEGGYEN